VIGAVTTVVVLGAIAEVVAFLLYAAGDESRPSATTFARLGGLIFYAFHHVGIVFQQGAATSDLSAELGSSFRVAAAALLGTFIGMWLLWRTGRRIGDELGGHGWVRGVHGAKVALPYALLTLALAFAVRIPRDALDPTGSPAIHPSYLAAFFWPLGLGALAGFLGGFNSARDQRWPAGMAGRHTRAALQGGAWMMGLALLLAFVGLLLLAPTHPQATAEYFQPFDEKFSQGVALIVATLLAVPNLAAGLILFPAMGTCLSAGGSALGFSGSVCVISWTQFPSSGINAQSGLDLPAPPLAYFLYLLVPLLAVIIGGAMAARKGGATTREQAVAMGGLAGVVYGVLTVILAILVTVTFKGSAGGALGGQGFTAHVGPEMLPGLFWPFLWGVVGGAIGGAIEARSYGSDALEDRGQEGATVPTVETGEA
jgi:hypothetical protein